MILCDKCAKKADFQGYSIQTPTKAVYGADLCKKCAAELEKGLGKFFEGWNKDCKSAPAASELPPAAPIKEPVVLSKLPPGPPPGASHPQAPPCSSPTPDAAKFEGYKDNP